MRSPKSCRVRIVDAALATRPGAFRLGTAGLTLSSWLTFIPLAFAADLPPPSPETRAVRFLTLQVPRWPRENSCFSCHHNGDAARALIRAERAGMSIPGNALSETITWLTHPERWDKNGGEGPFNDKTLARVVFTSTLRSVTEARIDLKRSILISAAERLAADQADDGSWKLAGEDVVGAPASYGQPLATMMARDSLRAADPVRFRAAVEKADAWLIGRQPKGVFEAAVSLWATAITSAGTKSAPIAAIRLRAIDLIRRGQDDDGGWGPFVSSPPEVFDTSIVLLALKAAKPQGDDVPRMLQDGRDYLITAQAADGSWAETTRPSGFMSEAQHLSTTAWALMALLETRFDP